MRCPECNKFTGLENGEPNLDDFTIDIDGDESTFLSATVTGSATLERNCSDCGTTMKEGQFDFEEDITRATRPVPDEAKIKKMGKRLKYKPCPECEGKKVVDMTEDKDYTYGLKGKELAEKREALKNWPCPYCKVDGKPTGQIAPKLPTVNKSFQVPEAIEALQPHIGEGHDLEVSVEPGDVDESGGGRYSANVITITLDCKVTCSCTGYANTIYECNISAERQAGQFEEVC